jgi:hypothetical protein
MLLLINVCEQLDKQLPKLISLKGTQIVKNKEKPTKTIDKSYTLFPYGLLPSPCAEFVRIGADAIGCDPSLLALPMLSAIGAAIGTKVSVRAKPGWPVFPLLWTAVVGESGTGKTPALSVVTKPLHDYQAALFKKFEKETNEYTEMAKALKDGSRSDNLKEFKSVTRPVCARILFNDITLEAVPPILEKNPFGVLLVRDEVAGWLASFDRYSKGQGSSDAPSWLAIYGCSPITIDRKTALGPIHVPKPFVAITGGIQPAILRRQMNQAHRESGMAARFLFAWPPRISKVWTDKYISDELQRSYGDLINKLLLIGGKDPEQLLEKPLIALLSAEAKSRYVAFYNYHNVETGKHEGTSAAAWSKLEEHPLRIALVIHMVKWCETNEPIDEFLRVDSETMEAAIELTEWFKREALRIDQFLNNSERQDPSSEVIGIISQQPDRTVSTRDLMRMKRTRFPTACDAEVFFARLVDEGKGEWLDSEVGVTGRPVRRFKLH